MNASPRAVLRLGSWVTPALPRALTLLGSLLLVGSSGLLCACGGSEVDTEGDGVSGASTSDAPSDDVDDGSSSENAADDTSASDSGNSDPASGDSANGDPANGDPASGDSTNGSTDDGSTPTGTSSNPATDDDTTPSPAADPGTDDASTTADDDAAAQDSAGETNSGAAGGGSSGSSNSGGASSIPPGSGELGNETTCDGVDDDENGVIDDVDVGADGVCDCLALATLGLHGEWGGGDVLAGWLAERVDTPVTHLEDAELTKELLDPYQVLLIRDVSPMNNAGLSYSAAEVEALRQWVREGGGVMTVIGYSSADEISNVNTLLSAFSLSYGSEQIVQGEGAAAAVTEWFEHPLTVGITQVGADNGYPTEGQGTTIAAEDGYDLGKAVIIGDGHVLVWGDEWVTYESEWSGDSSYQVAQFWQNALRWLTRANECQVPAR